MHNLMPMLLAFFAGAAALNAVAYAAVWSLSDKRSPQQLAMVAFSLITLAMCVVRAGQLYVDDPALALPLGDAYTITLCMAPIAWVLALRAMRGRSPRTTSILLMNGFLFFVAFGSVATEWFFVNAPMERYDAFGHPYWGHENGPLVILLVGIPVLIGVMFAKESYGLASDAVERFALQLSMVLVAGVSVLHQIALVWKQLPVLGDLMFPLLLLPSSILLVRRQMLLREALESDVLARRAELDDVNAALLSRNVELARTVGELESAREAQQRMLANVSHELRTPLHAVMACTQLVVESGVEGEQAELLSVAQAAGRELGSLIDDLLDAARIESDGIEIKVEEFALLPALRAVAAELLPLAERRGLELTVDCPPDLRAEGDARRVRQVVRNLVANAVRYSEHGLIELVVQPEVDWVRVAVIDDGPGISEADIERIFAPFQRVQGASAGGTGLGLPIARELARRMGGELEVSSVVGEGSCFTLTLPRAEDLPAETAEVDASVPRTFVGRVLVVDDNPVNRLVASRVLASRGLEVREAEDGADVPQALESVDLVLMDCFMPGVDGFEATRRLRAEEAETGRHLPVIALTASALDADVHRALDAGMDDHLAKPLDMKALDRVLSTYLRPAGEERAG